MADSIVQACRNANIEPIFVIILISMIPLIEVRGAIPIAMQFNLPIWQIMLYTWIGSTLVIPILVFLLKPVLKVLKKIKFFNALACGIEGLFTQKAEKLEQSINVEDVAKRTKKELIALFVFVSIPVPITGTWSGSAVSAFLSLPSFRSILSIALGNAVAVCLMTGLTVLLKGYVDYLLWGLFAFIIIMIAIYVVKVIKNKRQDDI